MATIICTKCGQEITTTATHGKDSDESKGNYREDLVGGADGRPKMGYKHIKCPGQPEREQPKIDWDTPLPEADPSTWIVK